MDIVEVLREKGLEVSDEWATWLRYWQDCGYWIFLLEKSPQLG